MAHYRKRSAIEFPVARGIEIEGASYTVDLIAKRATGVPGYRMTLAYVADDGSRTAFVDLEPAPDRDEVKARADALAADPGAVRDLLHGRAARS